MGQVEYELVEATDVDVHELLEFYHRQQHCLSTSPEKLRSMLERSQCVVVAREAGRLVGIARGLTDGLRGYLAECKLDPACQGPGAVTRTEGRIEHDEYGIARELATRVLACLREAGAERIDVTAHGTEEDFCRDLGFRPVRGAVAMQMDPRTSVLAEPVPAQAVR
jgi:predicted N-acetyltransferase YhbS